MYRLVYLSQARDDLRWSDIDDICARSIRNNDRTGITGLLLHDGSRFLQVLEGAQAAISTLMARIVADPRHSKVSIVAEGPAERREFGDWDMTFQEVTTPDDGRSFADKVIVIAGKLQDRDLAATLQAFAPSSGIGAPAGMPPPMIAAFALARNEGAQPDFSNAAVMMTVTSSDTSGMP